MEIKLNQKKNKALKALTKKGINLVSNAEGRKKGVTIITVFAISLIAAILVAKFGIFDLYSKLYAAQAQYQDVHIQYETMNSKLAKFDEVQLEYRTYSMDWLYEDDSGKYVSVPRTKVLDLVEAEVLPAGTLDNATVNGDILFVDVHDMTLTDISKMCECIEKSPFVAKASLVSAETQEEEEEEATVEAAEEAGTTATEEPVKEPEAQKKTPEEGSLVQARISIQLRREADGEEK